MIITEPKHRGEFILRMDGFDCQDTIVLAAGQNLDVGAVLGRVSATGKYVAWDPGASDGSEKARAILLDRVDATAADTRTVVIAKNTRVVSEMLTWPDGATDDDMTAAAENLAIYGVSVQFS